MSFIFGKLRAIFLFFVNLFRRTLCCFKRKRRLSSDEQIVLSNVVVNEARDNDTETTWNDWEFKNRKPTSIEEHIEFYRQQQAKLVKNTNVEETQRKDDVDLFESMTLTPQITKQTKIFVPKNDNQLDEKTYSLDVQNETPLLDMTNNELSNWEENKSWENEASWETEEMLKETKRKLREQRLLEQQKKRQEKAKKHNLGLKVNAH